ncbi:unnamed protein product [Protopolystoma xenopodis]|uniref:Uncharacterized protein n=1 Tax=Protopolystoma xenopodis TaxID=117903 RepID=A0A448XJ51_9PLAT|nr:unnamed protein product [Protopolystoma xenopodis]
MIDLMLARPVGRSAIDERSTKMLVKAAGSNYQTHSVATPSPVKGIRKPAGQTCAYCRAVRALRSFQRVLNHERQSLSASHYSQSPANHCHTYLGEDDEDNELTDMRHQIEDTGTGVALGNPLVVCLSIVCHQLTKLDTGLGRETDESGSSPIKWSQDSRSLEQLVRLMGKELL